jgi:protein-S-isoprenylcysteine O-methyltransferase Ste14
MATLPSGYDLGDILLDLGGTHGPGTSFNSTRRCRMAVKFGSPRSTSGASQLLGLGYAWSGFYVMWAIWACFTVFLANPRWAAHHWPLPTVDQGGVDAHPLAAALIDLGLISLFGLQHSLMARPWFKAHVMARVPSAFQRATYVHAANICLLSLIVFWQPINIEMWSTSGLLRDLLWIGFVAGWTILLLGALSFGVFDLLGISQMRAWAFDKPIPALRLKTGFLYRTMRHPMYVGVLLALWSTPRMTVGHLLLAYGMTLYVLIAMRYEERDLARRFGRAYQQWHTSG